LAAAGVSALQAAEKYALRAKTVVPAAAKQRAGIHKPLKWLDSRFRGNDDIGVGTPCFELSTSFYAAC
jgi:hypothetical protein